MLSTIEGRSANFRNKEISAGDPEMPEGSTARCQNSSLFGRVSRLEEGVIVGG